MFAPLRGRSWGASKLCEVCLTPPKGRLLPLVYGTTAWPLWIELWDPAAWQATSSWRLYRLAYHQ